MRRLRPPAPRRLLLLLPGAFLCLAAAGQAASPDGRYHCSVMQEAAYDWLFILKQGDQSYQFDQPNGEGIYMHRDENMYVETYRDDFPSETRWYSIYQFYIRSRMLVLSRAEYGTPQQYESAKAMMVLNSQRLRERNPRYYEMIESLRDRFRAGGVSYRHDRPDLYFHRPDLYRWIPHPLPEGDRRWAWDNSFWQCRPVSALKYQFLSIKLLLINLMAG